MVHIDNSSLGNNLVSVDIRNLKLFLFKWPIWISLSTGWSNHNHLFLALRFLNLYAVENQFEYFRMNKKLFCITLAIFAALPTLFAFFEDESYHYIADVSFYIFWLTLIIHFRTLNQPKPLKSHLQAQQPPLLQLLSMVATAVRIFMWHYSEGIFRKGIFREGIFREREFLERGNF